MSDVRQLIHGRPMARGQVYLIGLITVINVFDGFDVLSAAFTASAIARDWSLGPERIGLLLSAGMVGMALGQIFLSPLADRVGRRPTMILCLLLIAAGMFVAGAADSLAVLVAGRVITGLGIGAMISCSGALVYEFMPLNRREFGIGITGIGFPLGAALGGPAAAVLMSAFGWRAVFFAGGVAALLLLPVVLWTLPESLDYLLERRPRKALARVNAVLRSLRVPTIEALPAQSEAAPAGNPRDLLRPPLLGRLVPLAIIYMSMMAAYSFALTWMPRLMTQVGHSDAQGISASFLVNVGGIAGALGVGLVTVVFGVRPVAVAALAAMALGIVAFGFATPSLTLVSLLCFPLGMSMFAVIVAMFSLTASAFPGTVRAGAIGIVLGAGRVGSAGGPYLAGVLLAAGSGRAATCAILALPALAAALLVTRLPQVK